MFLRRAGLVGLLGLTGFEGFGIELGCPSLNVVSAEAAASQCGMETTGDHRITKPWDKVLYSGGLLKVGLGESVRPKGRPIHVGCASFVGRLSATQGRDAWLICVLFPFPWQSWDAAV